MEFPFFYWYLILIKFLDYHKNKYKYVFYLLKYFKILWEYD